MFEVEVNEETGAECNVCARLQAANLRHSVGVEMVAVSEMVPSG